MISVRRREQADGVAVIFTALDSEYGAIREHLDGQLGEREERGSLYEVGSFRGRKATWTVAVTQTEAGNKDAAAQVERAVRLFSPQVIFFTGVAGGRKDVRLGDVVAADIVYDYQTGKDTRDGFLPGSRPHRPTHELVQRAKQVQRDGQWKQRIKPACLDPAPHALVKPLAAGDVVLADRRSETARFLSEHYASTVAVEMEAHGFLHGAYINAGLSSLVVRGISDLLTGKTSDTDQRWQPIAARHAAAFTFEVLSGLDPHRRPTADKAWDRLSKHGVRQILLASLATFLIAGGLFAELLPTSPSYVNLATGSSSGISVAPIRKACDDTPQNGLRSPATTRFSAIRLVYSRVLDGSGIRVYQGTYNGKSYDWLQSDITGNVAMARLTWYMPPHFAYWCDLPIPDKPIRAIPAQVSTVAIPTLVDGKQITFKACIWQSAPFTEGCSSILP